MGESVKNYTSGVTSNIGRTIKENTSSIYKAKNEKATKNYIEVLERGKTKRKTKIEELKQKKRKFSIKNK